MSSGTAGVTVDVLSKEYRISCPKHEQEALLTAASYLNEKISEIRGSGKVIGSERIAVMAALNIVHELMQYKSHEENLARDLGARLRLMQEKVDSTLGICKQVEL